MLIRKNVLFKKYLNNKSIPAKTVQMFSNNNICSNKYEIIKLGESELSQSDSGEDNHEMGNAFLTRKSSSLLDSGASWHTINDKLLFSTYSQVSRHVVLVVGKRCYTEKTVGAILIDFGIRHSNKTICNNSVK